ncbi:MAG: 3-hydroxyacyl-CoA dehydrogenase family protein [Alphaproteobacteria bacterium]|nr:3-hydroxyacyl-CoA dehydrogenase family protein [Alphaproteobacteria bacterium]
MINTPENHLETIVVVGAGRMGLGIVLWILLHGRSVILIEEVLHIAKEAKAEIQRFMAKRVERGAMCAEEAEAIQENLLCQVDYSGIKHADLVIECVTEDIGIKRNVYAKLEDAVGDQAIITSNASSLEISHLAKFIDNPGRFLGTHFFYPVVVNPIVELIRGNKSDPSLLRRLKAFFIEHGKIPVSTKDSPGFVVNRFFCPYMNTAYWLMEDMQISAATIDEVAIKLFGSHQGPIEISNWLGVHNVYRDQVNLSKLGHFYQPTKGLRVYGQNNEAIRLGDVQPISEAQEKAIRDHLLGCVFFTVLQILDEGVGTAKEIDLSARLGLRFAVQPCALMDQFGRKTVAELLQPILELHGDGMPITLEDVGQLCSAAPESHD